MLNAIREIRGLQVFCAFRVTNREILRSTSVNGQKSVLNHEKSRKAKITEAKSNSHEENGTATTDFPIPLLADDFNLRA